MMERTLRSLITRCESERDEQSAEVRRLRAELHKTRRPTVTDPTPLPSASMMIDANGASFEIKSGALVITQPDGKRAWFFPNLGQLVRIRREIDTILETAERNQ
jgi:hypothetical protein